MKISKTILAVIGTAVIACGLMSQNANAVPINGSIGFNGSGTGSGNSTTGGQLTFNNPMTVDIRIGDYSGVAMGTTAFFQSITWTGPSNLPVLTPPGFNSPEWTFTMNPGANQITYSFNLLALSNAFIDSGTVSLSGTGTARIIGLGTNVGATRDLTFATFSVQGSGGNFTFQIVQTSTSANGNAVPEGGSAIALLGIGVMGLEVLRRKLRTA